MAMIHDNGNHSNLKNDKKLRIGVLLDTYEIQTWKYNTLEIIKGSDYATIDLVILNSHINQNTSLLKKIQMKRKKLLYYAYTELERRIFHKTTSAFTVVDLKVLLNDVSAIEIETKTEAAYDWIEDRDTQKIKEYHLDVILQFGFRPLKGNILTAAKFGIWSYQFHDNTQFEYIPPGFWETFNKTDEQVVKLQILTENLGNGIVIYRSFFPRYFNFINKNINSCYLRSSLFVPRCLKKLYNHGINTVITQIADENKKYEINNTKTSFTSMTNFQFLIIFITHFFHTCSVNLFFLLFKRHWFLMYSFQDQISTSLPDFKKIIPTLDRYWADPHVFFKNDVHYIFFEEYIYKERKGHISLIEMQQSGKYSAPVKILEEPFHLSYPQIFEYKNTLYMIPESHQAKNINLYECTNFPTTWKHRAVLIDSVDAVDATILFYRNKVWLFTNIADPEGTSRENELYLFYSDSLFDHKWISHPMNPIISDIKKARPAGKIIESGGKLLRPSQCDVPYYGYGIKLNEIISLTENDYQEKEIRFIEPTWEKNLKGIHTINYDKGLTIIDGFDYKFSFLNIVNQAVPSIPELRKICQTPESALHDTFYGRIFGRRFSIYFTKLFLYLPVSGNQITLFWCLLDLIAAILFCFSNYYFSIIGAILVQIAFILDGTDGEVSRYRGTCSKKGEYLDLICHNISYPLLFIGIAIGVSGINFDWVPLLFGFSASFFFIQIWLVDLDLLKISLKKEVDIEDSNTGKKNIVDKSLLKIISKNFIDFGSVDIILIIIFFAAIVNQLILFNIFYGLFFPLKWVLKTYYMIKYKMTA